MKRLSEELAAQSSAIKAEFRIFPSGSAMLDIHTGSRAFVMAYSPKEGFGVDELHPDDGFGTGYRYFFETFEPAARKLRSLAGADLPSETPLLSFPQVVERNGEFV